MELFSVPGKFSVGTEAIESTTDEFSNPVTTF